MCPITLQLMVDPVLCEDGKSYERKAWEQFAKGNDTVKSPTTRASISGTNFFPNIGLRNTIRGMLEMRGAELLDAEEYVQYYLAEGMRCEGKDNAEAEKAFHKVLVFQGDPLAACARPPTACVLHKQGEACTRLVMLKCNAGNLSGAMGVMQSHAPDVLHREQACLLALQSAKAHVEKIEGTVRFVDETGRAANLEDGSGAAAADGDSTTCLGVEDVTALLSSLDTVLVSLEGSSLLMVNEGSKDFRVIAEWAQEKAATQVQALKALQTMLVIARETAVVEEAKSKGDEALANTAYEAAVKAGFRPPSDWFSFLREGEGDGDSLLSPTTELVANVLRHPMLIPICKVLKQVHPDMFLTIAAAAVLTDICSDLLHRIAKAMQPGWLMRKEKARGPTAGSAPVVAQNICVLGPYDYDWSSVEDAVARVYMGELYKHAKSEGSKAVMRFQSAHDPKTIYTQSSSRPETFDESQRMAWRNQDRDAEEAFLMHIASDSEASFVTRARDLSKHAGLVFCLQPVGAALEELLGGGPHRRITPDAVICLAAVLEYIAAVSSSKLLRILLLSFACFFLPL